MSYTQLSGKTLLETVWKGAKNTLQVVGQPSVCHRLSWTDFDQSNQQTLWPAEPLGKSNSYRSQSGNEREHLFHQEKPSALFFALLTMMKYAPVLTELMLQQHPCKPLLSPPLFSEWTVTSCCVTHINNARNLCQHFLKERDWFVHSSSWHKRTAWSLAR